MSEPPVKFTMSFATMFRAMLINLAFVIVPLIVLNSILAGEVVVGAVITMLSLMVLIAAAFAWFQGRKPTLVLHPDGMEIYDTRARLHYVTWPTISNIAQHKRLGFRFLTLDVQGQNQQLLMPLYLSDMRGFYTKLAEYAGPQHPLVVAVRESGAAG